MRKHYGKRSTRIEISFPTSRSSHCAVIETYLSRGVSTNNKAQKFTQQQLGVNRNAFEMQLRASYYRNWIGARCFFLYKTNDWRWDWAGHWRPLRRSFGTSKKRLKIKMTAWTSHGWGNWLGTCPVLKQNQSYQQKRFFLHWCGHWC